MVMALFVSIFHTKNFCQLSVESSANENDRYHLRYPNGCLLIHCWNLTMAPKAYFFCYFNCDFCTTFSVIIYIFDHFLFSIFYVNLVEWINIYTEGHSFSRILSASLNFVNWLGSNPLNKWIKSPGYFLPWFYSILCKKLHLDIASSRLNLFVN